MARLGWAGSHAGRRGRALRWPAAGRHLLYSADVDRLHSTGGWLGGSARRHLVADRPQAGVRLSGLAVRPVVAAVRSLQHEAPQLGLYRHAAPALAARLWLL